MKSTAKIFNYVSFSLNIVGFLLQFIIGIVTVATGGKAIKNLGVVYGWMLMVLSFLFLMAAVWNLFSNKILEFTKKKDKISIINGITSIFFGFIVTGILILSLKDEDYNYYKLEVKGPKINNSK